MKERKTKEVICISCGKKVVVKLEPFFNGYIGICPECKGLAYDGISKGRNPKTKST